MDNDVIKKTTTKKTSSQTGRRLKERRHAPPVSVLQKEGIFQENISTAEHLEEILHVPRCTGLIDQCTLAGWWTESVHEFVTVIGMSCFCL